MRQRSSSVAGSGRPSAAIAMVRLYEASRDGFANDKKTAHALATEPLGPVPAGANEAELAAWTVVSNVLLNLDEMLMKR